MSTPFWCYGKLFVRPFLVGPPIGLWLGFPPNRQRRQCAVEGRANHRAIGRVLLEQCRHLPARANQRADAPGALGGEVSDLDTPAGIDRDGARIGGVVRLGAEFDRLAALADGQFEAARRPAFVGVVGADYGEGEGGEGQAASPRLSSFRRNSSVPGSSPRKTGMGKRRF